MEVSWVQTETTKQVKTRKGGLRTLPFIIANETFEKVASIGLHLTMILYLTKEYNLSNVSGASILFLWSAVSNFLPIIGAFLSDSYLGRFRVIGLGSIISLFGMILLWLTTIIPQARPPHCNIGKEECVSPKPAQLGLLFSSFVLMSIGTGGIRPCSLAFGADQVDNPDNPKNERILQSFFNWYYASVSISLMFSMTVIVYIQYKEGWVLGMEVPVLLMLLSTVLFFLGSPLYAKVKADRSLFTRFAQVVVVAFKNRHLALPPKDVIDGWYYHKGSKLLVPTEKLRFLNKACILQSRDKDLDADGLSLKSWNLCSVQQVEEFKTLIRVLPLWASGIVVAMSVCQYSFQVIQARTMDRHLTPNFQIPQTSFGVFGALTLTIWVAIYDQIIAPLLSKYTKSPRGLSPKQRMGVGLLTSCAAFVVAGMVERKRRNTAIQSGLSENPMAVVNMSAFWLVPQSCLVGLAEAFNAIGQIEFYYSQFPKTMASIGMALLALAMAIANLAGSLVVKIVNDVTRRGGKMSWVSDNLNKAHYDYYYWLLAILNLITFLYYLICAWAYGSCEENKVWNEEEVMEE